MSVSFKAGEYTRKTEDIINEICDVLDNNGKAEQAKSLRDYKNQIENEKKIRVAFVGQFSSGKSSIISALTGNKHIKIGSDVTTQESCSYEWGNFLLVDTPGLHNNDTHDERAAEAIKTADLIVYCITSELFTPNTLNDFKNLAYEKNYISKMILVINKLSMEAADDTDELISNYVKTLNESLAPNSLDEINHCFVDVLDFIKGVERNRPVKIKNSRFENFIVLLNDFLNQKGLMCKLLTPILTAESVLGEVFVDEAETLFDEAERKTLSRLERTIKNLRLQANNEWDRILIRNTLEFSGEAFNLIDSVMQGEVVNAETAYEQLVNDTCSKIFDELNEHSEAMQEKLDEEISEIENSKQAQYYISELEKTITLDVNSEKNKKGSGLFKTVFGSTKDVVKKQVGAFTEESIKSTVKKVGKKIGHKFKPWEATKLAKNIGKFAEFFGPAMDVIELGIDIYETVAENKEAQKALNERREIRKSIEETAKEIRLSFDEQKSDFIEEVFNSRLDFLHEKEEEILKRKEDASGYNRKIAEYKAQLEELNKMIISNS